MRNTTVHNGVDRSLKRTSHQRRVELSNGVSCHENNGIHGEVLKNERFDLNRSGADVKTFDGSYTYRIHGGNPETRGGKISTQTDTVHINGPNGDDINFADAVHSATNVNGIRTSSSASELVDIRHDQSELCLVQLVRESLCNPKPSLPSMALWDDEGLQLFEKITQLPDYYISGLEKQTIEQHCEDIARKIQPGSMVVDLGCG